jgi:hypothetical protein
MDTTGLPEGGEFISIYSIADYEAAINAAPPGTLIKLGDLEQNIVTCTTCNSKMDRKAAEFHKHPKKCGACGDIFDENMERHEPEHHEGQVGAGTIKYTRSCKKVTL